jgi:hypothetical protein
MKKLIVEEVNTFRAEVRAQARAAAQIRRQDRCSPQFFCLSFSNSFRVKSLPIPSREEILSSPIQEHAPLDGATSGYTAPSHHRRPPSPIIDDPSEELERELAGTHLGAKMR